MSGRGASLSLSGEPQSLTPEKERERMRAALKLGKFMKEEDVHMKYK